MKWVTTKAHVSRLLVYRHPPASLFYTLLHPHQNFKIARIFHYFQNIIVFTSFGTFKHQFYFSKHKTENYRCKNRGFDCRPTFHAFRTNRSFRENYFVVNIRSGQTEIDGYQCLIILHHKYGLSIRSSLNNWYQSDVPEPFTDNLQTNNLLTSVEGHVLLFYLLNARGKVVFLLQNELLLQTNVTIHSCMWNSW